MDRRAFLGTLGLLAAPLDAAAPQPRKVWRIGWLGITRASSPELDAVGAAFFDELRQEGFREGRDVLVERFFAEGVESR